MLRERIYFSDLLYRLETLTVYQNIMEDLTIKSFTKLLQTIVSGSSDIDVLAVSYYNFINLLIDVAEEKGYKGNVWKKHVLALLLESENTFTLICEKTEDVRNTSIYKHALNDIGIMRTLMEADIKNICENLGHSENMLEYIPVIEKDFPILEQVEYVKSTDKVLDLLIWNYHKIGSGKLSISTALYYDVNRGFEPIANKNIVSASDMIGRREQKDRLFSNTKNLLKGKIAHNCLLVGPKGIGKRKLIEALIDEYIDDKLKLVEITKNQFDILPQLLGEIKRRGVYFIIFIDNLEENDLVDIKVLLEQSFENKPTNALLYATTSDESLIEHFPSSIYFEELTEEQYLDVVISLAKKTKLHVDEDFLKEQALAWGVTRPMSGKKAREFINNIVWELNYH